MNKDVGVNRLHELTPIHEIEQLVTIQEVNAGLLGGLPTAKPQAVWFYRAAGQRASKKVVSHRLQGTTLFAGFFLQFAEKLIVNRQSCSSHMQKHIASASRCQKEDTT
jgi:hypothetical protein